METESFTHKHTYPLILGQRVVDHQVLLSCSLARVCYVLKPKKKKAEVLDQFIPHGGDTNFLNYSCPVSCVAVEQVETRRILKHKQLLLTNISIEKKWKPNLSHNSQQLLKEKKPKRLLQPLATERCSHHLFDLLILGPELLGLVDPLSFVFWKNL